MKPIVLLLLIVVMHNLCFAIDLDLSDKRGFYSSPISLVMTIDDPTGTIKYTLDGSEPTPTHGLVYTNPINITTTTFVKSMAYSVLDSTKVKTHSYIFLNDVLNQPNSITGFPSSNYAFDNSIVNHATYGPQMLTALSQIPTMSIVMDLSDLNAMHDGSGEYKTSVELLYPNNIDSYQEYSGIERAGGSSFGSIKRNLRLSFKDIYGAAKFKYPIFGKDAADEFDQLALRPGYHGCMHLGINHSRAGSNDLADQVVRNFQINMSEEELGIHGNFMHLYLNGVYWGVYNITERANDGFCESYFDSPKENFDVIKRKLAMNGQITAWNTLNNLADNTNLAVTANYESILPYVDVAQFADYVIACNYAPHADDHSSGKNSFVTRDRTKDIGFKFWIWDTEPALGHYWTWNVESFGSSPYNNIFLSLLDNPEFEMLVADRLHCHCTNDGALSPTKAIEEYEAVYNSVNTAMILEAARWQGVLEYDEFIDTRDRIVNEYLPGRTDFTIDLYRNNNVYPNIDACNYNVYGGLVDPGFYLELLNPNGNGNIYYSLNAEDPRAIGGTISANAVLYNDSIMLNQGVYEFKSRIKTSSEWSAACPIVFYVGQNYEDLVINEIHYNPQDSIYFNSYTNMMDTVSGRNFEFIELKNIGTETVILKDMYFEKGISFKSNSYQSVAPGQFFVIGEDSSWFHLKYGFAADAVYSGKLENSGENLWLLDPVGNIIDSLDYNDKAPWDTIPDEGIFSLALTDATLDNSNAQNWKIQTVPFTPGSENLFCEQDLIINASLVNPSCFEYENGLILTSVSGGDGGPYNYLWNNGSTNGFINGLSEGTYIVDVTDNSGCRTIDTFQLNQPPLFEIEVNTIDQFYFNTADGAAQVNIISGGQAPYNYIWSDGYNANPNNNLLPGSYSITVEDSNLCTDSASFTIQAVDCSNLNILVSKTDESYFLGNNGYANVAVNGAYLPYNTYWSNYESSDSIINLEPGNYTVNIIDNRGCVTIDSIEIDAYICSLEADLTTIDQSYYNINNGSASINIISGTAPYEYFWNNGDNTVSINDLEPGNYSVIITGADSCMITEVISILAVDCNNLNLNTNLNEVSCYQNGDGSISTVVSGGNPPYSYNWNTGDNTSSVSNLSSGYYSVEVIDQKGCNVMLDSLYISEPQFPITFNTTIINESNINTADGSIDLTVTGGTATYQYFWSTGETTEDITNLNTGNYWVIVTDANACNKTENFTVQNDQLDQCPVPGNISLINPTNNGVTIFWGSDPNASSYNVEYSISGSSNWINSSSSINLKVLSNLQACTNYDIRISTNCSDGSTSDPSPAQSFTTLDCNDNCNDITTLMHINETQGSVILQWDLVSEAEYMLYSRITGAPNWNQNLLSFPFAILFNLNACTDYEWYVQVNCSNGNSSSGSVIQQFTTLCPNPKLILPELSNNVNIYPNPVYDNLHVVSKNKLLIDHIYLYNSQGQLIETFQNINQFHYTLNCKNLNNGVFWLDVRYENEQFEHMQFVKK